VYDEIIYRAKASRSLGTPLFPGHHAPGVFLEIIIILLKNTNGIMVHTFNYGGP
jgi:hypothetical protein